MSTNDQRRDDGNSTQRAFLGVLALIAFALAILCLILFVVFA